MKLSLKQTLARTLTTIKTLKDWQSLPIVETPFVQLGIPVNGNKSIEAKPYPRLLLVIPTWGSQNCFSYCTSVATVPANQNYWYTPNWGKNDGGLVTGGTIDAFIVPIRMG